MAGVLLRVMLLPAKNNIIIMLKSNTDNVSNTLPDKTYPQKQV